MKRVHLIISGDVQGVGFRAWIKREAQGLGLVGWVKNRPDETVEVVAEGSKDQLDKLIKECQRGPELAWVQELGVEWLPTTNEFVDFAMIY